MLSFGLGHKSSKRQSPRMSETQVVEQLSVEKLDDSVKKEMTDSGIQENNYNKSLESSLSKPSEKPSPNGDVYHENGHNDNSDHFQNHNADLKAEEHPEEDFEHINLDSEVVKTEEQPFDADKSFEDAVSEISDKLDAKVEEYLDQLDEQEQKVLEVIDNVLNKHKSVDEDKEGRSESGGVKQGEVNNGGADQDKTDSSTDQAENVNVDQGPHEHTSTDGKDSTEDVNQEGVPQDATEPSATEPAERNDLDNRVHVQLTPEALDGVTVEENTNIEDKVNVEQTEESKLKDSVKKEATEAFEKEETHLHNTESESSLPIEENPHDKQNQGEQYKQDESNVEATPEPVDNIEETFEKVETVPLAAEGATELAEKKSNDNIVVHSQEASELAQEQLVDKVPEKEQEKESTNVAPVDSVSLVYEATEAATRLRNASESEIIADTPERVVEENNERLEEETAKQDSEGLFESQEVSQEAEADFESQDSRQKSEALSESPVAQIEGALAGNTNVIDENKEEFKENPEETKQSTESNEEARKVEQEEEKAVEQNQQVDESLPVTENASDGAEANLAANEGAKTPEIFIEQHDEDLTQNEAIEDQKAAEPNNEFVDEPVRVEQLQSSDAVEPNTGLESEVDAKETAEAEGEVVAEGQAEIKVDSSDSQVAPVEANKASSEFNNDAVAAESEAKEEDVAQKASETQDSPVQDNVEETFEKVEAPVLEQQPNLDKSPSTDTLLDEQQPQVVVNSDVAPNAYDNVTKLEVVNGEVEHEEEHKHEKTGVAGKILKVFHNLIDRHLVEQSEPENLDKYKRYEQMAAESSYPIPYRSKLTEPFEPGQTLIVKGKTVEDSVRFTVSLHTATADFSGNDVPLHISVRFDEGKIVFNTFSKGEWGKEERKGNPFKKGEDVDLRVRAHDNRFTITANQKEIKEFEHRIPLSSVTHFSIDGDVFINHISWSGKYYPVPYESGIPGDGLTPGKTLLIYGTPEKKGKRFHINLLKKNGDIALHFNPRFDEKAIVRNSLINNEWGNEEREGKIALEKDVGFDLKIVNEEYAFQIFVNEERFCTYAHRLEPHDLNGLQIGGDVEITGIQIF